MKKTIMSLVAGFLLAGTAATSVSAQEYKIKEGDTLNGIAEKHETTVHHLKDINDLDTDIIFPEETLNIDDNQDQEQYEVEKGDTLGSISKEFDVSVKDLKEWNNLDSDLIIEGQKLNVQNAGPTPKEEVTGDQENIDQQHNQEKLDQVAPEEEQEAAEAEQQDPNPAEDQSANQEEASQEDTDQEAVENDQTAANQEDAGQEAVENDQSEANQEAVAESNQKAADEKPANEKSANNDAPEGKTISVSSTAYTAQCDGCSGTTTDGTDLNANPGEKVIAVDPDVIPLGSKVHVEGYGDAVAADTGGAINGDKIDVHVPDEGEANEWGNKNVDVTIID